MLLSEQDRSGNSIIYMYSRTGQLTPKPALNVDIGATEVNIDADATEIRLEKIVYTGRVSTDELGLRTVDFDYEPRPDPIYVAHSLVNPYGLTATVGEMSTATISPTIVLSLARRCRPPTCSAGCVTRAPRWQATS